ncbi:MAG: radical SAM protein [Candidatus Omnitrophota bacterium]|nr:radical SAM protein [Candidatus Omnitrophota bacterium]
MQKNSPKRRFHVILIKPSKYDDDGYVIRWWRGVITSNSLACLHALTQNACAAGALGPDVEPVIHCIDETVQKVPVAKICREIRKSGDKAIACMVGVQTNQYARGLDMALEFKGGGIPSMIGGFHVSGCIEMLPDRPPEIQEAIDNGITLVAGEVEAKWGELLKAAYEGRLEPVYDLVNDKPALVGVPGPQLPKATMDRFLNRQTSFDAGRGCPFHCSFCTIINIQGNTMRGRDADDIEKLVRHNHATGGKHIFITDDNFARHKDWEAIADRLIYLKEEEGIRCSLMIQTDTVAHKIPRFIEKTTHAGVRRVFIGLETVNPDNLRDTGKYQNQLKEYKKMLQAWRDHGALTYAGYILGFPGDTYESIMRDVEFLKREIPLDLAEFFIMTPLPGSKDHQKYYLDKVPMDPDTNNYDTMHVCTKHPKMTNEELRRAYDDAWKTFYGKDHLRTLLLRRKGPRRKILFSSLIWFCASVFLEDTHPLLGGFFRLKGRRNRRRGMPREAFIPYYAKRLVDNVVYSARLLKTVWAIWRLKREADLPENADYMDDAIKPEPVVTEKPIVSVKPAQKAIAI